MAPLLPVSAYQNSQAARLDTNIGGNLADLGNTMLGPLGSKKHLPWSFLQPFEILSVYTP